MGWLRRRIRWLGVLGILGGPAVLWFEWSALQRLDRVAAHGVTTVADVSGVTATTLLQRSTEPGAAYDVALAWEEGDGRARRTKLRVSEEHASTMRSGQGVTVRSLEIRYVPGGADDEVLVAADREQQENRHRLGLLLGLAIFLGGGVLAVAFWRPSRNVRGASAGRGAAE